MEDANKELERALKELQETLQTHVDEKTEKSQAELQKQIDELYLKAQRKNNYQGPISIQSQIADVLQQNADKFKSFTETKAEFQLKLDAATIGTGNFGTGVILGVREPGTNEAPMRRRNVLDLVSTMNGGAGSNPLTWTELRPGNGGPGTVAESATKPAVDWTYTQGTANAQVIAVTAATTMQAMLNMPMLTQDINTELLGDLSDELAYQVLYGDGTGTNLKGILQYAKAFTGSSLAGEIETPNIFDVLRAAILQARKGNKATTGYTRRTGYIPNGILVSPDRAAQMDLTKDTNGRYILPPFTASDGQLIKGIRVLEDDFMGDDDFLVGDFSKAMLNYVQGITIMPGYVNDQFVKNQITIRAEVFANFRIKYHDAWAFVTGDFTSAKALLLATT